MQVQAPLSIYAHIPFCSARCSYCAFNTYIDLDHLIPAYVAALCNEFRLAGSSSPHSQVHSLYFGGGTPSLLSVDQFAQLLEAAADSFPLADDIEISLEANPDDLSFAWLRELRALGCNRLSIGMQSANAEILRLFERQHDIRAVADAVAAARVAKFDNLNLDVIFGSPGESMADWRDTVEILLAFAPEHISMYGLELKGGTELRQRVDASQLPQPDDDLFADMYEYAGDKLSGCGYTQYEISNWSRDGKRCRHNMQYWRNHDYIGLGAGSHGYAAGIRYSTIAAPQRYIEALETSVDALPFPLTPAVAKHSRQSYEDELYDTLMMGLRLTDEGINRAGFQARFGQDMVEMFPLAVEKLAAGKLIEVDRERIRLSPAGYLLSNGVIREFVGQIKMPA